MPRSFIQRAVLGWLSTLSPMLPLVLTLIKNLLFKGVKPAAEQMNTDLVHHCCLWSLRLMVSLVLTG